MFPRKRCFTEIHQGRVTGNQQQSVCVGPEHDWFLGTATSPWATCFSPSFVALSLSCKNQCLWCRGDFTLHLHEIASAWSCSSRGNLGPKPPWIWLSTSESEIFLQENTKTRMFLLIEKGNNFSCVQIPLAWELQTQDISSFSERAEYTIYFNRCCKVAKFSFGNFSVVADIC